MWVGFILATVVGLAAGWAQARNRQEVIPIHDPAYTYLDILYLEAGLPQASTFRPFTAQEFHEYVARIPRRRLSVSGRRLINLLAQRITPDILVNERGRVGFSTELDLTLEYYTKLNADSEYFFSYGDRLPMLSFPLELWFFNSVYANATFTMKEGYRLSSGRWDSITYTKQETDPAPVSGNHFNIFSAENGIMELDWYFPFRGLISVGGPHWHFTYGRDAVSVGNGRSGNLLLSDFPDYYDSAVLSTHWDFFKYTAGYVYLEPWLTPSDEQKLESGEYFMRIKDYELPYKALMLHHLELRPFVSMPRFPQLNLFLAEAIMFGSQYPQLRDFNPFMIFHNWFEYERTNDSFLVGFNFSPFPHLELYGQYFMNEFDTAYEGGNNFPGAYGWLGGAAAAFSTPVGVFSLNGEFVLTDPLLYNRYHPLLAFVSRRRIWSYIEPDQMIYVDKPIGYFTGPDTMLVATSVAYRLPPVLDAELVYFYIEKGEKTTLSDYEETPGETTPTGTPHVSHVLALHLSFAPLPVFSIGGSCYYVADTNVDHQAGTSRRDVQASVHATVHVGRNAVRNTVRGIRDGL